jgi:cytochrome c oxidase cbb3-type subunit 4
MHLDYETVVHFTKSWGLIYFIVLMAIVLAYAFWPGSKKKFDHAARMPLEDDTPDTPDAPAAQGAKNHG